MVAPASARKWRMGFNSAFKGLKVLKNTQHETLKSPFVLAGVNLKIIT
jgi:hypothetical protein